MLFWQRPREKASSDKGDHVCRNFISCTSIIGANIPKTLKLQKYSSLRQHFYTKLNVFFFALPKAVSQATQETHILQLIRQFQKKSCATLFVKQEKDKAKKNPKP